MSVTIDTYLKNRIQITKNEAKKINNRLKKIETIYEDLPGFSIKKFIDIDGEFTEVFCYDDIPFISMGRWGNYYKMPITEKMLRIMQIDAEKLKKIKR